MRHAMQQTSLDGFWCQPSPLHRRTGTSLPLCEQRDIVIPGCPLGKVTSRTESASEVEHAKGRPALLGWGVVGYQALHAGHHQRQAYPVDPAVYHGLHTGSRQGCAWELKPCR